MKDEGQTMQDAMRQFADPGGELWIGDVMAKLDLSEALARQLRADSIRCPTTAGSGHPTSSLSAAEAGDAVAALDELLPELDVVLVMTVDPGFGGQGFIAATVPKIRRLRAMLDRLRPAYELEVDGGIHAETAALAVGAGAHVLVAGSAIFEAPAGVRAGMARLRASVAGAA